MPPVLCLYASLIVCLITPEIQTELIADVNGTIETTSYTDDSALETTESNNAATSENPNEVTEDEKETDSPPDLQPSLRSRDQPSELVDEITGFHPDVSCENAQFLIKILTIMLPLLKNEVPESSKTSYILLILKDLLKSSPEAAADEDILNKINDLILAIEKYHKSDTPIEYDPDRALRMQNSVMPAPKGIKSKVVFKYEVPELANPSCTSELLKIIKVVQNAIVRLVNNPLCKINKPLELPFYVDFEEQFKNPNLYSYLPSKNIANNYPYPYEIDHVDHIPNGDDQHNNEKIIIPNNQNQDFSFLPYKLEPNHVKPNTEIIPDDYSPNNQKTPVIDSHYPNDLYPAPQKPSPYDMKDNVIDGSQYLVPIQTEHTLPDEIPYQDAAPVYFDLNDFTTPSALDVNTNYEKEGTTNSEYFDLIPKMQPYDKLSYWTEPDKDVKYPDITIPTKEPYNINIFDVQQPHPSTFLPYDLHKQYETADFIPTTDNPANTELDITGVPNSGYVTFGPQNPDEDEIYYIHPEQRPNVPNKYDSASETRPTIIGVPAQVPHDLPSYNRYYNNDYGQNKYNPFITEITQSEFEPVETDFGPTESILPFEYDISPQSKTPNYPYDKKPNHRPDMPGNWPNEGTPRYDDDTLLPELYPTISTIPAYPIEELNPFSVVNPFTQTEYFPYENLDTLSQKPDIHYYPATTNPENPVKVDKLYPANDHKNMSPRPDRKILQIIKDNIDVVEHKIPEQYLTPELVEMIKNIKELLDLEEITVEEYVHIVNTYQIMIENVKRMDISNAVMKDLLQSITNLDKLDLTTGKSNVIELTYLIKRPKPLVYQPYYYIKYQLPYNSFLKRVEKLLDENPNLTKNPSNLHKSLIPISQMVETSPDLQNYGEDEILRFTFNNGTLVGAKVVRGKDVDIYNMVEQLRRISSDLSVDDTYQLIKRLESKLDYTPQGLFIKNEEDPQQEIHIKVNNKPILQKITKITSNKIAADKIVSDILSNINYLRSDNHDDKLPVPVNLYPNSNDSDRPLSRDPIHPDSNDDQKLPVPANIYPNSKEDDKPLNREPVYSDSKGDKKLPVPVKLYPYSKDSDRPLSRDPVYLENIDEDKKLPVPVNLYPNSKDGDKPPSRDFMYPDSDEDKKLPVPINLYPDSNGHRSSGQMSIDQDSDDHNIEQANDLKLTTRSNKDLVLDNLSYKPNDKHLRLLSLDHFYPNMNNLPDENYFSSDVSGLKWSPYTNPSIYTEQIVSPKEAMHELNPYESQVHDIIFTKSNDNLYGAGDDSKMLSSKLDQGLDQNGLSPELEAKLLEANLKANSNQELPYSELHSVKSPVALVTHSEMIGPETTKSHLIEHSQTYINGLPVEHSESYLIKKDNDLHNLETANSELQSLNAVGSLKTYDDSDYLLANVNTINNLADTENIEMNLGPKKRLALVNNLVQNQDKNIGVHNYNLDEENSEGLDTASGQNLENGGTHDLWEVNTDFGNNLVKKQYMNDDQSAIGTYNHQLGQDMEGLSQNQAINELKTYLTNPNNLDQDQENTHDQSIAETQNLNLDQKNLGDLSSSLGQNKISGVETYVTNSPYSIGVTHNTKSYLDGYSTLGNGGYRYIMRSPVIYTYRKDDTVFRPRLG